MERLPGEPSPEEIDREIERLLEELDGYAELFREGSHELQEEWYWVEMEARVALDRPMAKIRLEAFIRKLEQL